MGTDADTDTDTGTGPGPLVGRKAGTLRLPAALEGGEETGVCEGEEGDGKEGEKGGVREVDEV